MGVGWVQDAILRDERNDPHQRQDLFCDRRGPALLSSRSPPGFFRPCRGASTEGPALVDQPTNLDEHRGMAAQAATELRRLRAEVEADQASLRERRDELERLLAAAPSADWADAVEKTRYLLSLFAETSAAADPRRQALMDGLLADFDRLLSRTS
jgi:hypothetical protein